MKNYIVHIIAVIVTVTAILLLRDNISVRKGSTELRKLNDELNVQIGIYQHSLDSISIVIKMYDDSVKVLLNKNIEIKSDYEAKIEDFRNPAIVSDDSITRYISSKIHNR